MKKINWKIRLANKHFWIALIPSALLLLQALIALFGIDIKVELLGDKLLTVVNTLFILLTVLGVVNDPTTEGVADSAQAMAYKTPCPCQMAEEDTTE